MVRELQHHQRDYGVSVLPVTDIRQAAMRLRKVRIARADGGTWAQVAPLLGCSDGKSAKAAAHALERALRPHAARMAARKGWARDYAAEVAEPQGKSR